MSAENITPPYCTAPFTSVVVDPNKGVRPCCTFRGHLGNLEHNNMAEILGSKEWKDVQDQITKGEIPVGCENCYKREKTTGWSNRKLYMEAPAASNGNWARGITELEINSTNVCNFSCTHCRPGLSSKWINLAEQLDKENVIHQRSLVRKVFRPDPANMLENIKGLNLQYLDIVRFKGGEPMLNEDVKAVLKYLQAEGILSRVLVVMVTNASIIDEEMFNLLQNARKVELCLSVDGVGAVQRYIRIGDSANEKIEAFVDRFSQLPNVIFYPSISVMVYNVFSLDKLADWWNSLHDKYPNEVFSPVTFSLHVIEPEILSLRVLSDTTRQNLLEKYSSLDNADYTTVINGLSQSYGGNRLHNLFVEYTRGMDKIRGLNASEIIPELKDELAIIEENIPIESISKKINNDQWDLLIDDGLDLNNKEDILQVGTLLSANGNYKDAIALYEKFVSMNPREVELFHHLAIAYYHAGRFNEAYERFSEMILGDPYGSLEFITHAEMNEEGGFLQAPFTSLNQEIAFIQHPSYKYFAQGLALAAINKKEEGKLKLKEALNIEPEYPLAKLALERLT